ncbi:hypothetical protein CEXT_380001 [Caerostris extrusa]|uniref:Uncharacterized protein n=1 Tax=Caerostris extrusa TaxID=172846 RepID=A0AAV4N3Z5_CAEEX|nr:hypothetical protein CEXT_380001 [Caerostris extrusa]
MMEDLFSLAVSFSKGGWSFLVQRHLVAKNIIICEVSKIPIITQPRARSTMDRKFRTQQKRCYFGRGVSILNVFSLGFTILTIWISILPSFISFS